MLRYAYKSWYNYKEKLCPLLTCFLREWAIIKRYASACGLFHRTPARYAQRANADASLE